MKVYDATLPIREGMFSFPRAPRYKLIKYLEVAQGDPYDEFYLMMSNHQGTHVDAPGHYIPDEKMVEGTPLDAVVGTGVVLDMRGKKAVDRKDLEDAFKGFKEAPVRVLLKTDNGPSLYKPLSAFKGDPYNDFVAVTHEGAKYLASKGVKLVGIDYQSVGGIETHLTLWNGGIVIVEGLNLVDIPSGTYEIFILPILVEGADAAPARAILRQ